MSWKDELQPASFRGVPFFVRGNSISGGRRLAVYEYPLHDDYAIDDLGRKAWSGRVECLVLGDDYLIQSDSLRQALDAFGAAELILPLMTPFNAHVDSWTLREDAEQLGMATFQVSFRPAKSLPEARRGLPNQAVKDAALAMEQSLLEDFIGGFDDLAAMIDVIETAIDEVLADVERQIGRITSPIAKLIRMPANLAASIVGSLNRISTMVKEPLRALELYKVIMQKPDVMPPPDKGFSRNLANNQALGNLLRRGALNKAAVVAVEAPYASQAAVAEVKAGLHSQFNALSEEASDILQQHIYRLQTAVYVALNERAQGLPGTSLYQPQQALPAVVLAHDLYGQASRDAEILSGNGVPHPLFVEQPLYILER